MRHWLSMPGKQSSSVLPSTSSTNASALLKSDICVTLESATELTVEADWNVQATVLDFVERLANQTIN